MNTYYVSLVRELCGLCLKAEAPSKRAVAEYMVRCYGTMVWCSIYTEDMGMAVVGSTIYIDGE